MRIQKKGRKTNNESGPRILRRRKTIPPIEPKHWVGRGGAEVWVEKGTNFVERRASLLGPHIKKNFHEKKKSRGLGEEKGIREMKAFAKTKSTARGAPRNKVAKKFCRLGKKKNVAFRGPKPGGSMSVDWDLGSRGGGNKWGLQKKKDSTPIQSARKKH